jgi:hypothetical protein
MQNAIRVFSAKNAFHLLFLSFLPGRSGGLQSRMFGFAARLRLSLRV